MYFGCMPSDVLSFLACAATDLLSQRVSYVWIKGRWVAYPFQNNVSALDKEDQVRGVVVIYFVQTERGGQREVGRDLRVLSLRCLKAAQIWSD